MKLLDKTFVALGLLMATIPLVLAVLVMPKFHESFASFGAEPPWFTQLLTSHPVIMLVLPAVVLLVSLAWPKKEQRGILSIALGAVFAVCGPVAMVVAAYLPIWQLGSAIGA